MLLANGFIPNQVGEWITLIVFVVTVFVILLYVTSNIWNTHSFKRRFIRKKDILAVESTILECTKTIDQSVETVRENSVRTIMTPGQVKLSNVKTERYYVKFKINDSNITLEVSKDEFKTMNERQRGILRYKGLIFISFHEDKSL